MEPKSSLRDVTGADLSVAPPTDWVRDLDEHPSVGDFQIELRAGTAEQRVAEIVPDPIGAGCGNVLRFWLQHPHEPSSSGPDPEPVLSRRARRR